MRNRRSPSEDSERAFERLFRLHYAEVLAYASRRTTADAALDVAADTFLVAWRRVDEVPRDALPWLLAVARHGLANQSRAERRREALRAKAQAFHRPLPESPQVPNPDPEILAALAELPDTEREAILLIAWEGLTPGQAAGSLGCSAVAFRVRLHRARRRLSQALTHERREARPTAPHSSPREEPS